MSCPTYISIFACIAISYILASIVYLFGTNLMEYGTPFGDSLTPYQITLKEASAHKRRTLFYTSFGILFVISVGYFIYTNKISF